MNQNDEMLSKDKTCFSDLQDHREQREQHSRLSKNALTPYLCLPASFACIVPEGSYTLKVPSWIQHLIIRHKKNTSFREIQRLFNYFTL